MVHSYLDHLECGRCHATYDADRVMHLCPACGGPLLARYDLEQARREMPAPSRDGTPGGGRADLWRYAPVLPIRDPAHRVTLGEGWTPVLPLGRIGDRLGLPHLYLKDEGQNPTGTFKARGAAVGVSRARELGVTDLALPTAGNAGGAWATYGARGGLRSHVVMPQDAPVIAQREVVAAGGELQLVPGLISDAGKVVAEKAEKEGWFDASTLKEPYRIEGEKTMGYELVEQLGRMPDVIIFPVGGGVGVIGIYKAWQEMQVLGWVDGERPPRLVAVQAEGCSPIVRAYERQAAESEFFTGAETLAAGIRVPKALGDFLVLAAIYDTGGTAVAVTDAEIVEAMRSLGREEGVMACPEGAAALAGAMKLARQGWLDRGQTIVLFNTGSGFKYPELLGS